MGKKLFLLLSNYPRPNYFYCQALENTQNFQGLWQKGLFMLNEANNKIKEFNTEVGQKLNQI